MDVFKISELKSARKAPPVVLCLGNFDGVHIAHAALIERAKEISRALGSGDAAPVRANAVPAGVDNASGTGDAERATVNAVTERYDTAPLCGVFTFTSSPAASLSYAPPPRITDLDEKLELLRALGVDIVYTADFPEVRDMSPDAFTAEILTGRCGCVHAVCGFNFRYGAGGAGNPDTLSKSLGGRVSVVSPVKLGGETVSSTAIRFAVSEGDMEKATTMLGRPYSLTGEVVHGDGVGGKLGFATANQSFPAGGLIPMPGVYAAFCTVDGARYPSVTYVGKRPTFGGGDTRCESHLIDFGGNLYGKKIKTEFIKLIGQDRKFASPRQLAEAVKEYIKITLEYTSER